MLKPVILPDQFGITTVEKHRDRQGGVPPLDVVIVNWNSGELLRGCIASLGRTAGKHNLSIFVVDNASGDGSSDCLPAMDLEVEVVRSSENLGFAKACNAGAALGQAPYILILNPDTRVAPDTLKHALDYLDRPGNEGIGAVGARLVDDNGRTQRTCAREPTFARLLAQAAGLGRPLESLVGSHFMSEWDHESTEPVDQVMGAFLLIRRDLYERLGGFDERFFVYYEDVDLCLRVRQAGMVVMHLADATAWHLGGGTTDQVRDRRLFYMLRSQTLYAAKHFGRGSAFLVLAAAVTLQIPIRVVQAVLAWSPRNALQALRGGCMLVCAIPRLALDLAAEPRVRSAHPRI
jgi:GT2 family glycosyltransferase